MFDAERFESPIQMDGGSVFLEWQTEYEYHLFHSLSSGLRHELLMKDIERILLQEIDFDVYEFLDDYVENGK